MSEDAAARVDTSRFRLDGPAATPVPRHVRPDADRLVAAIAATARDDAATPAGARPTPRRPSAVPVPADRATAGLTRRSRRPVSCPPPPTAFDVDP